VVALNPTMTGTLADDHADQLGSDDWPAATGRGRDGGGRGLRHTAAGDADPTAGAGAQAFDDHGARPSVTDGTSALGSGLPPPTPRHGSAAAFLGDDDRAIPRVGVPAMGGLVPLAPVPPRRPLQRDEGDGQRIRRSRRPHVPASATAPIRRQSVYEERLIKPTDRPAAGPRPRRPAVPSWDEILFGTRTRTSD
jgi:hypothetical protein